MPARELRVSPLGRLGGFRVAAPSALTTIARWQEATDPQSPEGGSKRACTHGEVPTPRLLGDSKRWCCFGSHTLPSRTVALLTQLYPADLEVTLSQRGWTLPAWICFNSKVQFRAHRPPASMSSSAGRLR